MFLSSRKLLLLLTCQLSSASAVPGPKRASCLQCKVLCIVSVLNW